MKLNKISMIVLLLVLLAMTVVLVACDKPADVASRNLSTEADSFRIARRVIFYNGITGQYMFMVEGFCSLGNYDQAGEVTVTCKTGPNSYKKHFLGLSDNVTYMAEQIDGYPVDSYHYKWLFRPEEIIPAIEMDVSSNK